MKKVICNIQKIILDRNDPNANAILLDGKRIKAIGDYEDFLSEIRSGAEIIDAENNVVCPGFIDAHNHFSYMGMEMFEISLDGLTDPDAIRTVLREANEKLPQGQPLLCTHYEIDYIHNLHHLTKEDLDKAAPGRLIQITDRSGHMSVTNELTLNAAGIPLEDAGCMCPAQPTKFTGEICGTANSKLSHFFLEHMHTPMNLKLAWKSAAETAVAHGVTSLYVMCIENELELLSDYCSCLPLHLKLYTETKDVERVKAAGLKQIGGCGKVVVDGDTGPFTAAFFEPYIDRPETRGCLYYSDEELNDYVWNAHHAGIQIVLHCVGDRASWQLMNAIEKAQQREKKKLRHRIEHFEFADDVMKDRAKQLGICLSIQPSFNHFWPHTIYADSLGSVRANQADPIRSLSDRAIPLAFGSDCPVTPCDPLLTIHSAVNHSNPIERISAAKALHYQTIGSAFAGHEENERGSIAPGKFADLVILGADPSAVPPKKIKDIPIIATISAGELVYHL